jgi:hypothetical protein
VALTLDEAARLAGGYCWAEGQLFSVLGGWVASTPETAVKLLLDRHSQHHAWRGEQWRDRLPVLADVDPAGLVAPLCRGLAEVMAVLPALDATVFRLAAAYRVVLPRLAAAYESHLSRASPVSDGSTIRTLRIVGGDLAADWREGELMLQTLIRDEESVRGAAATVVRLERAFLPGRGDG